MGTIHIKSLFKNVQVISGLHGFCTSSFRTGENFSCFSLFRMLKLEWCKIPSNIQLYLSYKSFYVRFSLPLQVWENRQIGMFTTAVQKMAPFQVKLPNLVNIDLFKSIMSKCDSTYMGQVFKVAYCLGFFGFLRLSNLVPRSITTFSYLKHVCKGDIFFQQKEAIVLLKWTKTMQSNNKAKLLKIPVLDNQFCPVKAIKDCLKLVPGDNNSPLLQIRSGQTWMPMTDSRVRNHLKNVLMLLQMPPDFITFHTFRRSGASLAFNHNVPLQDIQRHGTWTSDCVWRYVTDSTDGG